MGSEMGSNGSVDDLNDCNNEYEGCESHDERKIHHRHSPQQLELLERFYKECPYPTRKQQHLLGTQMGLDPKQIKFWFQNKRTQTKVQKTHLDNEFLRTENARIQCENTAIQSALQEIKCSSCSGVEDQNQILQNLQRENTKLKNEIDRMNNIITPKGKGKGISTDTSDLPEVNPAHSKKGLIKTADLESEKLIIEKTAANAMDVLIKLIKVDHPMWIKCSDEQHYALNSDFYNIMFPMSTAKLGYFNPRVEASKYSDIVAINARLLVDLYLDPGKWVDYFPTIFSKAKILNVLEGGLLESRHGSLQLVYEQMHALSPIIRPREFNLIQHCQQIETGVWVIVMVSYASCGGNSHGTSTCWCWKHPSGCMIQELPSGFSKVTCVEHVEFDGNIQFLPTPEIILKSTLDFGAKRWVMTLLETCQMYSYLNAAPTSGQVLTPGRKNMIMLSRRMVKNFCSMFHLFETTNLPKLPKLESKRVRLVIQKNTIVDRPLGTIICAGSSFWVPKSPAEVIDYLSDYKIRSQWDIHCNESPVYEILNVPIGSYSKTNAMSILKPSNQGDGSKIIFQESTMRPSLESLIVYAPINMNELLKVGAGMDPCSVPILASGFAITPCGRAARPTSSSSSSSSGTIVNMAIQILACNSLNAKDMDFSMLATADAHVSHAVSVIEAALGKSS